LKTTPKSFHNKNTILAFGILFSKPPNKSIAPSFVSSS